MPFEPLAGSRKLRHGQVYLRVRNRKRTSVASKACASAACWLSATALQRLHRCTAQRMARPCQLEHPSNGLQVSRPGLLVLPLLEAVFLGCSPDPWLSEASEATSRPRMPETARCSPRSSLADGESLTTFWTAANWVSSLRGQTKSASHSHHSAQAC